MNVLRRLSPSPAMVVASIALLVALTGTGIAAVTAALPRNSVGTAQLKNNAVTSAKVARNAINSNKVENRSLLAADFAPGQVPAGPQGPAGPAGPAGPSGPAGVAPPGYVAEVASDTSDQAVSSNATSFTDLTGASETVNVPSGQTARLYVWFSAESQCTGGAGSWCSVRVTVDGNEIEPAAGTEFAFDSAGSDFWEGHSIVRVSGTLAAGSHTVKIQGATTSAGTTLRLDDWSMIVQRVRLT